VSDLDPECDLVVVGAGIVGLAHAVEAQRRGLTVMVVERDERAVGASVRNFGHVGVTGQAGRALELARASRTRWIELGRAAGIAVAESGAVVVARATEELAVLTELADERGDEVRLLSPTELAAKVPVARDVVGGAFLPLDLRVDQRRAVGALAVWLAEQLGVGFRWRTSFTGLDAGVVHTSRGPIAARHAVVCVGDDVDRWFPAIAQAAGVQRCVLHMLRVTAPTGVRIDPALLSGTALWRYGGFLACPSAAILRAQVADAHPELLAADVNLMVTQLPDGDLIIGDTHHHTVTVDPFRDEHLDDLLLAEAARLLGVDHLAVRQRWQGTYASAPDEFLVATPQPDARVVSVTSGIGMTTAFGLAEAVLDDLLGELG
jgi:FAD dependent oxidoreductase TIGR03364